MADDEDQDELELEPDEHEERGPGTEGEGTEGKDGSGRDEESDLSAQRSDKETDEGTPPSRRTAEHEAEPRGSARFRRLANENKELRERAERAEREREQERQQWTRQQQTQTEQQERERLALMTPEERAEYRITQHQRQTDARLRDIQMSTMLQMDKSAFDAKAQNNPVYRRMQSAVEQKFQEQMRSGQPTDRETILKFLLGEQALNGAADAAPRRRAQRRVEQERVAPARPSGDRAQARKTSTAEDRLKDVLI